MGKASDDYATRAAALRRLADDLRNERERSALLAIADQYEAVAARLKADEDEEEADRDGCGRRAGKRP